MRSGRALGGDRADRRSDRRTRYVVLAPNLFYRAGRAPVTEMPDLSDPDARGAFFGEAKPMMDVLTPDRAASDGDAYLRCSRPRTRTARSRSRRRLPGRAGRVPDRRSAPAAGRRARRLPPEAAWSPTRGQPHRTAARSTPSLYLGFADNDQSMSPEEHRRAGAHAQGGGHRVPRRGLRGRGARVHDAGHAGVRRGSIGAALRRSCSRCWSATVAPGRGRRSRFPFLLRVSAPCPSAGPVRGHAGERVGRAGRDGAAGPLRPLARDDTAENISSVAVTGPYAS